MKKLCLTLLLFFGLQLTAMANTGISFVYINGSNIYGAKIHKWYENGIQKFHPYMKMAFEKDPSTRACFLKGGNYFIEDTPVTFYWGDKSYNHSSCARQSPDVSRGLVAWLAHLVRLTAVNVIHDIIWVKNYQNMVCVLDNLHQTVLAEAKKCNKIVLFGYSSGSIIAYDYLLAKTPYIDVSDFFNSIKCSKEQRDFVAMHPMKDTCVSALANNLAIPSADGHLLLKADNESFKRDYLNLDTVTENICIPKNTVMGVVNIASPMLLFQSDISDPNFQLTYYNRLLYKYIIENGMFWLTVNYREDPMSFPSERNLTAEEIENITGLDIYPHAGFIYDKSDARGGLYAITHMAYLSTRKTLAKTIVKAYSQGCKHQCDCKCGQKTLNIYPHKFNVSP